MPSAPPSKPSPAQVDAAIRRLSQAAAARPGDARARHTLALLLLERGRRAEARRHLEAALAAQFAPAAFALGRMALEEGELARAEALLRAAASAPPLALDSTFVLAEVLERLSRREEAAAALSWVIARNPPSPAPYSNLLHLLIDLDPERAEAVSGAAVRRFPDNARLAMLRGYVLLRRKKAAEAIAPLRRALALDPEIAHAPGSLLQALRETALWGEEAETMDLVRAALARSRPGGEPAILLHSALNFPFSRAEIKSIAAINAAQHGRDVTPLPPATLRRDGPLVVGYLSPDFRNHAVAHVFADTFAAHDPARVRAVAFSVGPADGSDERRAFAAAARPFVDLRGLSDRAAAERIRAEGTHILVDLGLYTQYARAGIAAHRPAPVQAAWLGLAATSGAPWFDYLLTDDTVAPRADEITETPVHLPHGYHPACRLRPLPPAPPRAAEGLPEDAVVFGSFNHFTKIDGDSFAAWIAILSGVPGSVLWLRDAPEAARQGYRAFAAAHGVAPERLAFAARTEALDDHVARLGLADLMLDCLIYGAHTTCLDALRAGVPMLTVLGEGFAARVGASILGRAGLPELVLPSRDAFVAEAIRLGRDAAARAALRRKLAVVVPAAKTFDADAQARALEDAFDAMWAAHEKTAAR